MIQLGKSDIAMWAEDLKNNPRHVLRIGRNPLPYTLMAADELHAIYDPEGKKKVMANGVARALKAAGFDQAYRGNPILCSDGVSRRLWIVNPEEYKKYGYLSGKQIAETYDFEHASAPISKVGRV
jgi:hypothetical protein